MSKVIGAETTAKVETQLQGKLIAYWLPLMRIFILPKKNSLKVQPYQIIAR